MGLPFSQTFAPEAAESTDWSRTITMVECVGQLGGNPQGAHFGKNQSTISPLTHCLGSSRRLVGLLRSFPVLLRAAQPLALLPRASNETQSLARAPATFGERKGCPFSFCHWPRALYQVVTVLERRVQEK